MASKRPLTLDDIDIVAPIGAGGTLFAAVEVANLLLNGGPLAIAKRLVELAETAAPPMREALLGLAHQVEPGPAPQRLAARCRVEINRQPDHLRDPEPDAHAWGEDMADFLGERWLRQQLKGLE